MPNETDVRFADKKRFVTLRDSELYFSQALADQVNAYRSGFSKMKVSYCKTSRLMTLSLFPSNDAGNAGNTPLVRNNDNTWNGYYGTGNFGKVIAMLKQSGIAQPKGRCRAYYDAANKQVIVFMDDLKDQSSLITGQSPEPIPGFPNKDRFVTFRDGQIYLSSELSLSSRLSAGTKYYVFNPATKILTINTKAENAKRSISLSKASGGYYGWTSSFQGSSAGLKSYLATFGYTDLKGRCLANYISTTPLEITIDLSRQIKKEAVVAPVVNSMFLTLKSDKGYMPVSVTTIYGADRYYAFNYSEEKKAIVLHGTRSVPNLPTVWVDYYQNMTGAGYQNLMNLIKAKGFKVPEGRVVVEDDSANKLLVLKLEKAAIAPVAPVVDKSISFNTTSAFLSNSISGTYAGRYYTYAFNSAEKQMTLTRNDGGPREQELYIGGDRVMNGNMYTKFLQFIETNGIKTPVGPIAVETPTGSTITFKLSLKEVAPKSTLAGFDKLDMNSLIMRLQVSGRNAYLSEMLLRKIGWSGLSADLYYNKETKQMGIKLDAGETPVYASGSSRNFCLDNFNTFFKRTTANGFYAAKYDATEKLLVVDLAEPVA